jgi:hypothetical protein
MLTIFSTPKPFRGHVGVIQRNAIQSWKLLHPDCEVILLGPEEGAAEIAREFGLRHEPVVRSNERGTKFLGFLFDRAQETARHDLLCYVNCDIVLTDDFCRAVERVSQWRNRFLMAGRRWDLDLTAPVDFSGEWGPRLRAQAVAGGKQRPAQWIDYFVFSRGLYAGKIPPFVIGRPGWDNWLLWHARNSGVPVVDASAAVVAIHQNHDYSYHPDGEQGVWEGDEARRNYELIGGWRHFHTVEDATHRLRRDGIARSYGHWFAAARRALLAAKNTVWFGLLNATRPLRRLLGLRAGNAARQA